ncbi:hypothetical protein R69749_07197 [Paraburkholderia domus]|uniref:Uncharacterized protein n=1 Tax=Paraburkholderia domus TaxID=2793075 RepID=A0A9N8R5Z2_9BURK|nr:hypothetical protein R70006_07250 [Paraburkholderia domus]CAE6883766.1 hypothetical protein R69749_07197 [Paraburkholderia domus]CAE6960414.1 hypothetical protein R70199_07277 [Paraburkholderia domus]CAE6965338.1 hypothetical protein R70211_07295 [Paraburkholderia domus]
MGGDVEEVCSLFVYLFGLVLAKFGSAVGRQARKEEKRKRRKHLSCTVPRFA